MFVWKTRPWKPVDGDWTPDLELPGARGNDRSTGIIIAAWCGVVALFTLLLGYWVLTIFSLIVGGLAGWRYSLHVRERIGLWPDRLEMRRGPRRQVWPFAEIESLRFRYHRHGGASYAVLDEQGHQLWIPHEAGTRVFGKLRRPMAAKLSSALERDGEVVIRRNLYERFQLLFGGLGGAVLGGWIVLLGFSMPEGSLLVSALGALMVLVSCVAIVLDRRFGKGLVISEEGLARVDQPQSLIRWADLDRLVIAVTTLYVCSTELDHSFAVSLMSPNGPLVPQLVHRLHPEIAIDNETREIFLS